MIRTLVRLVPEADRGKVVGYALLTVVSAILRGAACLLLVPLLGALFSTAPADALPWLGALTVSVVLVWVVDTVISRIGFDIGFTLLGTVQRDLTDRITRIPLGWFTAERTATARQAVAACGPELVGLVANLLTPLLSAVLLPVVIAIGLTGVAWQLGAAAGVAVAGLLAALWATTRITRAADAADTAAHSALTERILEFARTQQALRAARRVEPARNGAGAAAAAQHGTALRLVLLQIPGQLLFGLASQAALVALAGAVTLLYLDGGLGAAEAVALVVVAVRFLEPFTVISELAPAIESVRGTLDTLRAILDAPAVSDTGQPAKELEAPRVEFQGVSFGYGTEEVLRDLSFTLEPGTTTAIVGPSGSGKSTILALVAGFHEPVRGRVLVDGQDVARLDPATRQRLSSMVFQHPYLFDGTIRDNVLAGDPDAGGERVAEAMRLAQVDEILGRLPDGERTDVGEAGAALSGGERQRVSIARALLKPAPVLLIDEATSALDAENEAAVAQALSHDVRRRTRVIVAHRLGGIRHADRVLFVEDGTLVEEGTVEGLRAEGGRFAEFWRHQEHGDEWRLRSAVQAVQAVQEKSGA
ncbi:ABC transporter ATP-binding protein [Streptosporangium saharense]|uniref:ATP-binding cassette subfamily B protein IrtB n=1 Tax=Streptosporangium saharense TaxID=1706840 RepID=A0A7W7VSJ1_9ACTN|nr:ABC transporter ATP-binding protein [Streptosporangium saharense]MBB4920818.1 ATP-binding cassette subfamily B protein IrtB [Streptosporangium saharense]